MFTREVEDATNESFAPHLDSDSLLKIARDESKLLLFREAALFELSDRGIDSALAVCDQLLTTGNIEDWFCAVHTLKRSRTEGAFLRLFQLSMDTDDVRRMILIQALACNLTQNQVGSFMERARHLARPGAIDVTGLPQIAVDAFELVCKRYNVPVDRHRIKTSELGRVRARRMKVLTKEQTTRIWV